MKNLAGILGVAVGVAAVTTALFYRKQDGTTVADGLLKSARETGNKLAASASKLKDRFLNHVHGPNGEAVYLDMYDRQFYEDATGNRVYMDNA